jgi:phosphatidylethanolamine-binding protein (PEBP) family uncharacterized protein
MRKTLLIALITTALPAFAQSSLTVDFEWKISHRCSTTSPALVLSGIPKDAKSLQVAMVDLDFRSFDHGGGGAELTGEASVTLPEGALKNYRGPCPPNFSSFGHDYEFTVKAIGADGRIELARASKTKTFSAKTVK